MYKHTHKAKAQTWEHAGIIKGRAEARSWKWRTSESLEEEQLDFHTWSHIHYNEVRGLTLLSRKERMVSGKFEPEWPQSIR